MDGFFAAEDAVEEVEYLRNELEKNAHSARGEGTSAVPSAFQEGAIKRMQAKRRDKKYGVRGEGRQTRKEDMGRNSAPRKFTRRPSFPSFLRLKLLQNPKQIPTQPKCSINHHCPTFADQRVHGKNLSSSLSNEKFNSNRISVQVEPGWGYFETK